MTSQELADSVLMVCMEANRRILTVGDEQYAEGERQRHEDEDLDTHLKELEEELLDTINHAGMTVMKIRERRARVEEDSSTQSS